MIPIRRQHENKPLRQIEVANAQPPIAAQQHAASATIQHSCNSSSSAQQRALYLQHERVPLIKLHRAAKKQQPITRSSTQQQQSAKKSI
ncbi:hypothetical protein Dimus_026733 [Dionaea muscipula]